MDNITIYEFLQEKNIAPLGPDNYSNSMELGNSSKAKTNKKANINALKELYVAMGGNESDIASAKLDIDILNKIADELGGDSNAKTVKDALHNIGQASPRIINKGPIKDPDVRFLDYDGTVLYEYSAEEFIKLTAMPANPTHDGLICQGWNYTLEDAKSYVTDYGMLDIGAMYITDDGKTRIYIHLEEGALSPFFGIRLQGTCYINWGDGYSSTMTGSGFSFQRVQHSYSKSGDYIISFNVIGSFTFSGDKYEGSELLTGGNNDIYSNSIQKIEIGSNITDLSWESAFLNCKTLASITIPTNIQYMNKSGIFTGCGLRCIIIPNSVKSLGSNLFAQCPIKNISIPKSVTTINNYLFDSCIQLTRVIIPNSITSIPIGMFRGCSSLTDIIIPNSVTSISSLAFQGCTFTSFYIPNSVKTISGDSTFANFYLKNLIISNNSITQISEGMLRNCTSLQNFVIPNSVTSIAGTAFAYCHSLANITIPDSVTQIHTNAFYNCSNLKVIKFKRSTPATISGTAALSVNYGTTIYVPRGSLSAYTSASNYPSSSTCTYVEY